MGGDSLVVLNDAVGRTLDVYLTSLEAAFTDVNTGLDIVSDVYERSCHCRMKNMTIDGTVGNADSVYREYTWPELGDVASDEVMLKTNVVSSGTDMTRE